MSMKAYVQPERGPIAVEEREIPKPKAGKGELVIQVAVAGVNPIDHKIFNAFSQGLTFPAVSGTDGSGIVDEVGEGVTDFKKGDRVFFHTNLFSPTPAGAYAQYAVSSATGCSKIPTITATKKEWNIVEAGTSGCVLFTAAYALLESLKEIKEGTFVFINGGAGGVGSVAVQIALAIGATVITSASTRNVEFVTALASGADEQKRLIVLDYTKEDLQKRVAEITGARGGADRVFDTISTEPAKMIAVARFDAEICFLLATPLPQEVIVGGFMKNLTFKYLLAGGVMGHPATVASKFLPVKKKAIELIEQGKIRIPVTKQFQFTETKAALEDNVAGKTQGKTAIIVNPELL